MNKMKFMVLYGDMHTCRGVAFLDDMRDGVFVFFRL